VEDERRTDDLLAAVEHEARAGEEPILLTDRFGGQMRTARDVAENGLAADERLDPVGLEKIEQYRAAREMLDRY
jgi:hypothetical protein